MCLCVCVFWPHDDDHYIGDAGERPRGEGGRAEGRDCQLAKARRVLQGKRRCETVNEVCRRKEKRCVCSLCVGVCPRVSRSECFHFSFSSVGSPRFCAGSTFFTLTKRHTLTHKHTHTCTAKLKYMQCFFCFFFAQ